jgi:hypothetical protein
MRSHSSSSEYGEDHADSKYGDAGPDKRAEQCLYGEPCHEVGSDRDEQTLYGEPQHETREESSEDPDLELLFVRMRVESGTGPTTLQGRSSASQRETTEQ